MSLDVNVPLPITGRMIKEDSTVVNQADMLEAIYKALCVDKNAGVSLVGSLVNIPIDFNSIVVVPFDAPPVGSASGGATGSFYYGFGGKEYGNGSSLNISVPIGIANWIRRTFSFRGNTLAILRDGQYPSNNQPYTVVIDGVCYEAGYQASKANLPLDWYGQAYMSDQTFIEVMATDLADDITHEAEIIVQGRF